MVIQEQKSSEFSGVRLLAKLAAKQSSWSSSQEEEDLSESNNDLGVSLGRKRDVKAASKMSGSENFRTNNENGSVTPLARQKSLLSVAALALMTHLTKQRSVQQSAPSTAEATPALRKSFSFLSTPRPPTSTAIRRPEPININESKRPNEVPLVPQRLSFESSTLIQLPSEQTLRETSNCQLGI